MHGVEVKSGWAGLWINEHLAPTLWRLASVTADGVPLAEIINYVGRTERMDQAWNDVVAALLASMPAARAARKARGLPPDEAEEERVRKELRDGHAPNRNTHHTEGGSKQTREPEASPHILSAEGVRKLCASELFRHEWECAGYAMPPECRTGA